MLVYGRNVAKEMLNSEKFIKKVILQENFSDKNIISLIEKKKIDVEYMNKRDLGAFAKFNHQGIILDVEDFKYSKLDDFACEDDSLIVILDHLEDPHNLVNSTVIKTSTGAINNIPVAQVTNLCRTITDLKNRGYWIVGTDMIGDDDYRDIDYSGKIAIVIGNEGKGMSDLVRKSCDFVVKIPMFGKVNSLNASVSAGILIYEAIRNKR